MQIQHIIILVVLAACFLLLTVFSHRAIMRALRRSYWAGKSGGSVDGSAGMNALNADIATLARGREYDRKRRPQAFELKIKIIRSLREQWKADSSGPLTQADLQVLSDTAITLGLLHKTGRYVKGNDPCRTRGATQVDHLNSIIRRTLEKIPHMIKTQIADVKVLRDMS